MKDDDSGGFAARALGVGCGCVGLTSGALFLFGACCWLAWLPVFKFGVVSDLEEYQSWVLASNLQEPQKSKTVSRIRDIEKSVNKGVIQVPLVVWGKIDGDIDDLIEDKHFSSGEHKALLRLLTDIEKYRVSKR